MTASKIKKGMIIALMVLLSPLLFIIFLFMLIFSREGYGPVRFIALVVLLLIAWAGLSFVPPPPPPPPLTSPLVLKVKIFKYAETFKGGYGKTNDWLTASEKIEKVQNIIKKQPDSAIAQEEEMAQANGFWLEARLYFTELCFTFQTGELVGCDPAIEPKFRDLASLAFVQRISINEKEYIRVETWGIAHFSEVTKK